MDELQRRADNFIPPPPFTSDAGHQHQLPHEQTFKGEQNQFPGCHPNISFSHAPPQACQKRQFSRINGVDYSGFVKLYVSGIPRTAAEQDIDAVFGEHGHIVEIVLLKDKVTGLQQECCFVKYATIEQAEQAIWALHGQFTFGRGTIPITVKYADGERERIGTFSEQVRKLYVNYLNKQAQKWEIGEIFSPFGIIEDIYIIRDEFKQNRGCAFIQYSCRDMAIAAIEALHGSYVMRGCDQPLVVRFADPKKPRVDSRPTPYPNYSSSGNMTPNEMQQSKSSYGGCKTTTTTTTPSTSSASASIAMVEHPHPIECEWSEHISPDGELYYYNCVTCESKWEMPEEYELYEQEIDNKEQQQLPETYEAQLV